jgi:hypothetical protein
MAPDYNMLTFAKAHWDQNLTAEKVIDQIARMLDPHKPEPWKAYLFARREAFTEALAVCKVPNDIYFDYRFMPEMTHPFGQTMVKKQSVAAEHLRQAAKVLSSAIPSITPRAVKLADSEAARASFEAEDIKAMSIHQKGLNGIANYLMTHDRQQLKEAISDLEAACKQLERADKAATSAGVPETAYYHAFNRNWSLREIREKIETYSLKLNLNL